MAGRTLYSFASVAHLGVEACFKKAVDSKHCAPFHQQMSWNPEARILALMKLESGWRFKKLDCCPDSVARQAASLMYYKAEVGYLLLGHPGYIPHRVIEDVENIAMNLRAWFDSGPGIIQAEMDITDALMKYYSERDPAVLDSLKTKCASALTRFGLDEVPGIMAAIHERG